MSNWIVNQFYDTFYPISDGPGFKKGANPFAKNSQETIELLESITPVELASCVPYVKIEKVDRTGRASDDVRPLMYDLVQGPRFAAGSSFGVDNETFIERSLVSLNSLQIETAQLYGQDLERSVTLTFTVHHPAVVFDRASKVAWREILMPGKTFTLEYGWRADPTIVKNPLFNGDGHITESGQVLKPSQFILLSIHVFNVTVMANGEVKVVVSAKSNGDLALRESKFSDAFDRSIRPRHVRETVPDDVENIKSLKGLLNRMTVTPVKGKGGYILMGDILDKVIAPMMIDAGKRWGYQSVDLLLGNFNDVAPSQSKSHFGQPMAGKGIENFRVPTHILMDRLAKHTSTGRSLLLYNFISDVVLFMNGEGMWDGGNEYEQPNIVIKSETIRTEDGIRLIFIIHDIKVGAFPFGKYKSGKDRIAIEKQSRENIFNKLRDKHVPILEYARAGSLITDSSFVVQPNALLQAQQIDEAHKPRKTRVQYAKMPDTESRKGQSRAGQLIVPVSILEGTVSMHGNFALELFGRVWIDFYGSKEISGCYSVMGKTDIIEPGTFKSTFKVMSEGIDPLNTRNQEDPIELDEAIKRGEELRKEKKPERRKARRSGDKKK
jgi:hypothetical protein